MISILERVEKIAWSHESHVSQRQINPIGQDENDCYGIATKRDFFAVSPSGALINFTHTGAIELHRLREKRRNFKLIVASLLTSVIIAISTLGAFIVSLFGNNLGRVRNPAIVVVPEETAHNGATEQDINVDGDDQNVD